MLDEKSQAEVGRFVRGIRIVVVALAMGIVTFAVVAVLMGKGRADAKADMVTFFGLGMAVVGAGMHLLVPRGIVLSQRRKIADGTWQLQGRQEGSPVTDAGKLAVVYFTKTIVGCALLEGACFVALLGLMIEGHVINLVVGALLLLGVVGHFPTSARVADWVTEQLRLLEEERQLL